MGHTNMPVVVFGSIATTVNPVVTVVRIFVGGGRYTTMPHLGPRTGGSFRELSRPLARVADHELNGFDPRIAPLVLNLYVAT